MNERICGWVDQLLLLEMVDPAILNRESLSWIDIQTLTIRLVTIHKKGVRCAFQQKYNKQLVGINNHLFKRLQVLWI